MNRRGRGYSAFEYFALRCVPRVDREEFVNVGVVLYSQANAFLDAACKAAPQRLRVLDPDVDVDAVQAALRMVAAICRGEPAAGPVVAGSQRERFGWLAAPRSTVVQPGPVHAGLTSDPAAELARLYDALVR